MSSSPREPVGGQVSWEAQAAVPGATVHRGQREVNPADVEVLVRPPAPRPRLWPPSAVGETVSWLVTRGRSRTRKRLRLGAGFWLVLPEQPGPARPPGMALQAERDGERSFCWEWFEVGDDGATATKRQETGTLQLEWAANRDGHQEVVGTTFVTDVSLRLEGTGPRSRDPIWRVRVLAGSVVRWPQAGEGIRLVPRLPPP